MTRVVTFVAVLTVALCGMAPEASAQVSPSTAAPAPEMGLFAGAWNINGSGSMGLGARLTVYRSEWLGTEYSVEAKKFDASGRPSQGMLIVNARLSVEDATRSGVLLTAGGAIGVGYRRTFSPMIGVGAQRVSNGVGTRVELQYFPGGQIHQRNDARLTFGVVVALR